MSIFRYHITRAVVEEAEQHAANRIELILVVCSRYSVRCIRRKIVRCTSLAVLGLCMSRSAMAILRPIIRQLALRRVDLEVVKNCYNFLAQFIPFGAAG